MEEDAFNNDGQAIEQPINTNGINDTPVLNYKVDIMEQVKVFKLLGNTEFIKGEYMNAINYFTNAIEVCPESNTLFKGILYNNRATAYSNLNLKENCIADCIRSLEYMPRFIKTLTLKSKTYAKLGNFKQALEDMAAAIMLNENNNSANISFGHKILKRLGEKNLEEYMKYNAFDLPSKIYICTYLKSFCDDPYNDEFPQALVNSDENTGLELALKCLKDQNYEKIIDACKEELDKTNNSLLRRTYALNLHATFSILCGNCDIGIEYLSIVIETPKVQVKLVTNSLIKRGIVYHQQELLDKSYMDFKRAEMINPNSPDIYYHRAQIFIVEKNNKRGIEEYKRAIELKPTFAFSNIEYYYAQFINAQNNEDADTYLKKLEDLTHVFYDCPESYILYAKALIKKKRIEDADMILKEAIELFPENANTIVHRAIVAFSFKKSIDDGFDLIEHAFKVDPKCENAYECMVKFCLFTGKLYEAVECLEKAIPLTKSKKDLMRIFSIRDSTIAHIEVANRYGLNPQILQHQNE